MPSKNGIRSSKAPGNEAGAVTKNSTSQMIYDSGSESEYETDSNGNEGPPPQDESSELSLLASTSEFSFDNLFHKDIRKHAKFLTTDLISSFTSQHSDITDEFIVPITPLTRSFLVQVMDRDGGPDFCITPASSFRSQPSSPTGSAGSGESFFSIQLDRNSFTNQMEALVDARNSNLSVGETILRNNVDDHDELSLEGPSRMKYPTSHLNDFVLPLTFPRINEKKKRKKKKEKKKKGKKKKRACLPLFCCKWPSCHCKFPTCSCKCFSWPSCSSKCLSCSGLPLSCSCWPSCCQKCCCGSGCCKCSSWSSCCQLPSCSCKSFSCLSGHCKCSSWSCCGSCPTWSSCSWRFWNCRTK